MIDNVCDIRVLFLPNIPFTVDIRIMGDTLNPLTLFMCGSLASARMGGFDWSGYHGLR